jgi:hypothetical protein
MRIFAVVALSFMLATPAAAQSLVIPSTAGGVASAATEHESVRARVDDSLLLPGAPSLLRASATQAPAAQPAAPPRPPARRRGSMVGYIADAAVESKVRVRVDSAFENTAPDRAEFFYAKCGCYSDLPPSHVWHDADAPGPKPGAASEVKFQQLDIWGEYAFNPLVSVFVQLPVRWLQPQTFVEGTGGPFPNQSGLSDLRTGVKVGFEPAPNHLVTAQGQFFFPTGDAAKGLGTDHASVEPGVLYSWQATSALMVESQLAVWIPFGGSASAPITDDEDFSGRVLTWGVGSGYNVFERGDLAAGPVVELVGWRVLSGYQTGSLPPTRAEDTNIVNIKIGGRVQFDVSNSVYVGYGKGLTDSTWYDDIWRFEYRFSY